MANKGLYYNINKRKKEGKAPLKPSSKNYPTDKAFEDSAKTAKEEYAAEGKMETARKNVGADKCWDGYKAKGTKKKDGKTVPNCVKEGKSLQHFCAEASVRSEKDSKARKKKIDQLERLMKAAKAPKAVSELGESITIEDSDGNTVAEVIDLIKPEPMTGWRQQVMADTSEENREWVSEVLDAKKSQ